MPDTVFLPHRKRLIVLLIVLLLVFGLACGVSIPRLGIGVDKDTSTPTAVLDSDSSSSGSDDSGSAAIDEPVTEQSSPDTTDEKLAGEQILILWGGEPPTFDPHLSGDGLSAEYVVEIFSGLMVYDPELNLIPDIAKSYEISDDGLVYTFEIRPEAKFQDGRPIRAEDFKWSFERACDPATGSHTADTYLGDIIGCRDKLQGQAGEVEGVVVVDDLTFELTIDEPKGFFLAKMTYPTAYVLDRENVESGGSTWFTEPNGSGPFKLSVPNPNVIILEKNDNYYREPKPILERVIYLINVPVRLMTGYEEGFPQDIIDGLELPDGAGYDLIPVTLADLSRATDPNNPLSQDFVSTNAFSVFYVGFNVNKPPFDEIEVRQAFNLALDKQRMIKRVYQGSSPAANGIVPPGMPGYQNPDLSDYQFDPERALELIAESSYGDVSELPPITLHVSSAGDLVEAIVRSYEANLGVKITVEEVDWPEFLQDLNQPDIPYQMYQLGWIADYPDPQNFLEILFHSQSAQNHGGYSNPTVDDLLDEARGTQDVDQRLAMYRQVEQIVLDDAAWIPLHFEVENWLVKPHVQNFQNPPIKVPKFQYVSIAEP